jgi:hypothetical protein
MCVTPRFLPVGAAPQVAASGRAVDATVPGARDIAHHLVKVTHLGTACHLEK